MIDHILIYMSTYIGKTHVLPVVWVMEKLHTFFITHTAHMFHSPSEALVV